MKNLKNIFITLAFLGLFACNTEIDFEGEITSSMLVINSFITPDSVIKVHVSKSKFFLKDDNQFDVVDNATVNLWVNNIQKETLIKQGNGYYISNYKPMIGDIIKITAKNAIFSEVDCSVEIMDSTTILSFDTIRNLINESLIINYNSDKYGKMVVDTVGKYKNEKLDIVIQFQDNPQISNYYRMVATRRMYFDDGKFFDENFYLSSDDIVFGDNSTTSIIGENGNNSSFLEFSDEYFSGQKYAVRFYSYLNGMEYFAGKEPKKDDGGTVGTVKIIKTDLILNLQTISKSYYLFLKSISANSSVIEFFSEPVQIHSNVNGGIGILGSYTSSFFKFQIPISDSMYGGYGGYKKY